MGLEALRRSFDIETGYWLVLYERFTKWSDTRPYHPWIVTFARSSFYHGMPRASRGGPPSLPHERHESGHEQSCYLDRSGWVVWTDLQQLHEEWFVHPNWYSCTEPEDSDLLDRIDVARGGGR